MREIQEHLHTNKELSKSKAYTAGFEPDGHPGVMWTANF